MSNLSKSQVLASRPASEGAVARGLKVRVSFEEWIGVMGKQPPAELPRAAAIRKVER